MKNLNLVELLSDCPTGIELDSTVFDNITFDYVNIQQNRVYCKVGKSESVWFTPKGGVNLLPDAKCVIFPKGKTTWEGFHRPFKDGDILYVDGTEENDDKQYDYIFIFNKIYNGQVYSYCHYYIPDDDFKFRENEIECLIDAIYPIRLATEEEKQKLFDAIKANGYKWNAETKTLEKLVEPKFKVGDKIEKCGYRFTIAEVQDDYYLTKCGNKIPIDNQDDFSLVPNKFDITTLKPFDKVLVRNTITEYWRISLFGAIVHDDRRYFLCLANSGFYQCIPYEHNEHLLATSDDCDDFYKTWEE